MSLTVEIIGEDRIKAVLERVSGGMDSNLREKLDLIADQVKEDAKAICPVDTGSLQKSIRKEAVARPAGNIWEIGVRAGGYITNPKTNKIVNYASHVEYGTSRARAQPFMRPALLASAQAVKDAISGAVKESVEEAEK